MLIEELRTFATTARNDYSLLSNCIREIEEKIGGRFYLKNIGREIINKIEASRKNIAAVLKKFNL